MKAKTILTMFLAVMTCVSFLGDPFHSTALFGSDKIDSDISTIKIVMVGDSTMASYAKPPADRPDLTGWGQVFSKFFNDDVKILNHASSGRSSKSFIAENRWSKALADKPNYVFIQFGHNDGAGKGERSTNSEGDFKDYLRQYIRESREIGAQPILVTPVARRTLVDGKIVDENLKLYVIATRAVAAEEKCMLVDLNAASIKLFEETGDAGIAFQPSETDRTHFSRKGAEAIAKLVADQLPQACPDLAKSLKSTK